MHGLDFDGRIHRQGVFWDLRTGASFGTSTAEVVSRVRCRRAGLPARHSGGVWTWGADFFCGAALRDLKLMFTVSRRADQLSLRSQQRIVATVEDSVLRTEMTGLESEEEDVPKRILFFKPMS